MEPAASAPSRRWRTAAADALLVLLLLGLALKLTYNISRVRDLGTCDEVTYMLLGSWIPKFGLPRAEGCPLYALWYFGVSRLEPDPARLYYLSWSLLVALLAAGFYLLVRALGGKRPAALAAAFLLLTSSLVDIHPYPAHLATLILVLGCTLAVRLRPLPLAVAVLGLALLLAGYARPEYFVGFLLFCAGGLALALVALWRCPRCWPLVGGCALLVLLPAALLARTAGVPLGGGRSFIAFGQHYAHNVSIHRGGVVNPMYHWERVVRDDFGDAHSFGEALRSNPRAVLWHVGVNVRNLPRSLVLAATPNLNVSPQMSRALGLGLAAAVLLGIAGVCRRVRSGDGRLSPGLALLGLVLVPAVASCLLVFPRLHYLMPGVTLTLALTASSLPGGGAWGGRLGSRGGLAALAAVLVLLTPNRGGLPWDLPTWLGHRAVAVPVLSDQRTVAALRSLRIETPVVLLDSSFSSRAFYAGLHTRLVVPITDKREAFGDFLRRTGIDVVVIDPILRGDAQYRGDPEFRAFVLGRRPDGFTRLDVPGCPVRLAVRAGLLPPGTRAARAARPGP